MENCLPCFINQQNEIGHRQYFVFLITNNFAIINFSSKMPLKGSYRRFCKFAKIVKNQTTKYQIMIKISMYSEESFFTSIIF